MKKVIIYGNQECPHCVRAKETLDREGIRYGEVDVLAGLAHLKKFLALRDTHPEIFTTEERVRKNQVGIPAIVVEDKEIYLDVDDLDLESLKG